MVKRIYPKDLTNCSKAYVFEESPSTGDIISTKVLTVRLEQIARRDSLKTIAFSSESLKP